MLVTQVNIALPCATQNEVSGFEAEYLVSHGCKCIAERFNMGSTLESIEVYESDRTQQGIWYGPGKAANSNSPGVALSGLETARNSERERWTAQELDQRLKNSMSEYFSKCFATYQKYALTDERLSRYLIQASLSFAASELWRSRLAFIQTQLAC